MKYLKISVAVLLPFLFFQCVGDDNSSKNNSCSITVDCGAPEGLITPTEANNMEELYKAEQFSVINEIYGDPSQEYVDAREVWFSLEEIKKYIYYVESNVEPGALDGLGLRVYFGAKMEELPDGTSVPRTTIFFVPTHENPNVAGRSAEDGNLGINPLNFGSSGRPPKEYN